MKIRKTFVIEGSQDQLEIILALFESGELNNLLGIKILDVGITSADKLEAAQVISVDSQPLIRSVKEELDLYRKWLDSLLEKEFHPAVRSDQSATSIKSIQFKDQSVELVIKINRLTETKIQIFLQVRPSMGKGYLPEGLKATIFDDFNELMLERCVYNQTNLLDITHGQKFTCELNDSFSVALTLGNQTIRENFPG